MAATGHRIGWYKGGHGDPVHKLAPRKGAFSRRYRRTERHQMDPEKAAKLAREAADTLDAATAETRPAFKKAMIKAGAQ